MEKNYLEAQEMLERRGDSCDGSEARNVPLSLAGIAARFGFNARLLCFFLIATLSSASVWLYADWILVTYQVKDAAANDRPRGNLSDLYPRWLGARELLLHRVNPYSDEVTAEIQKGYYGRVIDPDKPNDPKDQERFAYPVYVVFLLAPSITMPFQEVQFLFHWTLLLTTAASVWLWSRSLRWSLPVLAIATATVLTLGSIPAVQGIKIQQLSLLVAALIALAVTSITEGYSFAGGVLMALATIKPQLAWAPAAALLGWSAVDWRKRRGFAIGFVVTMAVLLAGAEIVLPGWWKWFAEGIGRYHGYTQNQSVIEVTLNEVFGLSSNGNVAHLIAQLLAAVAAFACGVVMWKWRTVDVTHSEFGSLMALVLALTALVVPMYAPYNQILLLPAVLVLLKERREFVARARWRKTALALGGLILAWQWVASIGLLAVYFLISHERALQGWTLPFLSTFAFPVWTFGLIFMHLRAKRTDAILMGQSSR